MSTATLIMQEKIYSSISVQQYIIYSDFLERDVIVDIYSPLATSQNNNIPLLLVNDGQDLRKMDFASMIDGLISEEEIQQIMVVAIHCSIDRIMEYGTACRPDFKGRGAKAGMYNKFLFDELMPFIRAESGIESFTEKSFAGFSLGGLCALDVVWNHPLEFTRAGVFSGSLWWRRRGYNDEGYSYENDRIMHLQVQKGAHYPWLKFFFECGDLDESADRNNNGIIDSIEDTMDIIKDLEVLGYGGDDIKYLQLADGGHNIETWARAFPDFLKWGWGRN